MKMPQTFVPKIKKIKKEYSMPNLITKIPISTSDIIMGGAIAYYLSKYFMGANVDQTDSEMMGIINDIAAYIHVGSKYLMNGTFAAMCGSGAIDYMNKPPKELYKLEISEKLGVKRKEVNEKTRKKKIDELCLMIKDDHTEKSYGIKEEAEIAGKTLDKLVYKIEGVKIKTSNVVKKSYLAKYMMPHALGGCNLISKDIDIFQQMPYISPSIVAHELCHRKGYFKENDAEVLAHLAGFMTDDPVFIQSSRISRLRREWQSLKLQKEEFNDYLSSLKLPVKMKSKLIKQEIQKNNGDGNPLAKSFANIQLTMYKILMRILGQKEGLERYTRIFTEDLHALEKKYKSIEDLAEQLKSK